MDAELLDRWARGLNARLARRGFGKAIAAGVAALGLSGAVGAKKKKRKKKPQPPAGCTSPNVACSATCCPPDQPCVNGRCGCGEGEVFCDLGDVAGCVRGNCCPSGACAGNTCCPADTFCSPVTGGAFACRCSTRQDDCAGRCCPTGQACYDGECGACRTGQSLTICGPQCVCATSVENAAACVDGTTVLDCHDCETDAACATLLGQPAVCIARTPTESCPNGRTCIAASCPDQ